MKNGLVFLLWIYMAMGIWSTYYYQTLVSPIIYTVIALLFTITFALLGKGDAE